MKDKYLGIVALCMLSGMCIWFKVDWAKEIVMLTVTAIAAFVKD